MEYNPDIIDLLALKVTADYQAKIKDGLIDEFDAQVLAAVVVEGYSL